MEDFWIGLISGFGITFVFKMLISSIKHNRTLKDKG